MANCCLSHSHLWRRSCTNTAAWDLSGLLASMPGSVEVSVAPPSSTPGGCGREPFSATSSVLRVVPSSPGRLQTVAPAFICIFHTPLHEQVMVLAGDRVWEGSKEEKMFNLVLEACLGFNSQRREKRHSRQRKRQGAPCRRSPPWQG